MNAPLIAIVGSYDPKRADKLILVDTNLAPDAGVELGRELARQGCHIAVYASYPFLLEVDVVKGYVEVKKSQPEPGCIQVHYSVLFDKPVFPEEMANRGMFAFNRDTSREWEVSFYRSLSEVDGMLMLGGGPSSMIAGVVAMGYRKPIVAIAYFGGCAKKIWELLREKKGPLTDEEVFSMGEQWRTELAKPYVGIFIKQREQREREEQEKNELAARTQESLRLQLEQKQADFNQQLEVLNETSKRELEAKIKAAIQEMRDNKKAVQRYALVSAIFLLLAMAVWVIAAGGSRDVRLLMILLLAAPLAAGISGSTIQVVFGALGIGQPKPTEPQPALPSVITNAAMGLVGGGITALLYIITQLVAIGDVPNLDVYYRRLIPFALFTGFAAGFALDVVARKLRDTAMKGVGSPFPPQPPTGGTDSRQ